MLLEFKVKNFLSFENEQQFIMNAGKGRSFNDRTYRDNYNKILNSVHYLEQMVLVNKFY